MPTEKKKVTRKLSAILSADVKGYSVLMADDEVHTIETLKAYRQIISDLVSKHSGRVVDSPGDNILAEFRSSVDAVECAVKIQIRLELENAKLVDDKKVQFRIGVNVGDVIQDGDRIYGNGVNVAARIEGLAEPGGICISRNAYSHVRDKLELGYEYLGEHSVKNIKRPARVYKVLMDPEDAGKLLGKKPKPLVKNWIWATILVAVIIFVSIVLIIVKQDTVNAGVPSIAILPFTNLSDDPEQGYLADGLTDELIGDLAKIKDIFVISRNSTFTYKGKDIKIPDVAKELNVHYILEGSIQWSGDKLRIRAQLIDGKTDHHVWSESYDGELSDIFDLQDKITENIVSALAIKLSPVERKKLAYKGTDNIYAYEYFLKGKEHFAKHTPEDFVTAIDYYKKAIEVDPNFSRVYAAIGAAYLVSGNLEGAGPVRRLLSSKYLELAMNDPTPRAYSLASAKWLYRKDFEKAEKYARKTYASAPNSADRIVQLAWILVFTGKPEESNKLLDKAIQLDPLNKLKNTAICNIFIGINHFSMQNYEKSIAYMKAGLNVNPNLAKFSCILAASHSLLGQDTDANEALGQYLNTFPKGYPVNARFLYWSWPFKNSEIFDKFIHALVKAGLQCDPSDYYTLNQEEKLNGNEIKELLFGKTSTGHAFGVKVLENTISINNDGDVKFTYLGKTYIGKAWIENDNICLHGIEYFGGLKDCHEIYSNPIGDKISKSEYFRVTEYGIFLFSIES